MDIKRYCPFVLLKHYSHLRGKYKNSTEKFFIFRDGTAVKPRHMRGILRAAISDIGLDPNVYDTHSLRIGRATNLMKQGVGIEQIKFFGRWKSNAVFKYLRDGQKMQSF